MKQFTSALAVFMVTAMVATSAFAQAGGGAGSGAGAGAGAAAGGTGGTGAGTSGTGGSSTSDSSTSGSGATTGSPATGVDRSRAEEPKAGSAGSTTGTATGKTTSPAASPTTASGDYTGRHTMEGEVVRVDQAKGKLTLKTAEGNMDLHFPPSALASVKKGDRIAVELAMKPAGSASMNGKDMKSGSASPKMEKEKK